jgi:hypothetical protein
MDLRRVKREREREKMRTKNMQVKKGADGGNLDA